MRKGHVGSFNNTTHNCMCSDPGPRPKAVTVKKTVSPVPNRTKGSFTNLIKVKDPVKAAVEARAQHLARTQAIKPAPRPKVLPEKVKEILRNMDIIDDMVVQAKDAEKAKVTMEVVETPENLAPTENAPTKMFGGKWMWWLVGGVAVYAIFSSNGTQVVKV